MVQDGIELVELLESGFAFGLGIDVGGSWVGMAELELNEPTVVGDGVEASCVGMTELVWMKVETAVAAESADATPQGYGMHVPPLAAIVTGDKVGVRVFGVRVVESEEALDETNSGTGDKDNTDFGAFTGADY